MEIVTDTVEAAKENLENAWESVKRRTRRLSGSLSRSGSPIRDRPPVLMNMNQGDQEPLAIKLGELNLVYEDLDWMIDGKIHENSKKYKQILERNQALEAENHVLKFKIQVLLDMLTTAKLDVAELQHTLPPVEKGNKEKSKN